MRLKSLKVRVDPRDRGQSTVRGVLEEARRILIEVQQASAACLEHELELLQVGEVFAVSHPVLDIGQAERSDVVGIPAPRDTSRVKVPNERILAMDRHFQIVAAPARAPRDRVEAVRPRRSRDRAVPAVTHTKLGREMVEHGQVGGVVVAHNHAGIPIVNAPACERVRVAGGKTIHRATVDLPVGRRRRVLRVPTLIREYVAARRWIGYRRPP